MRYFHLHAEGAALLLEVDRDYATLGYAVHQSKLESTEQIGDGAVAGLFNVLRELCGPQWAPLEAHFAHRRPDDVAPFRRLFQVAPQFDAELYGLLFASSWLDRALPQTDPELQRLLQRQIDTLEQRHPDDFPARVRGILLTGLLTGHGSADHVASLLSMHSRTLHRRLSRFGTSFQRLVDEVSFEFARQMLEDSSMNLGRIAEALDYADASAFARAFRRWSGHTPTQWRAQAKPKRRGQA